MLLELFNLKKTCNHSHVPSDVKSAYCPDCGAYVENKWYLTRCSCCNIKRPAVISFGQVKPREKYCPNCGAEDFYVEEIDKVNFINIDYCVYKKVVIEDAQHDNKNQVWIEFAQPIPLISAASY